MMKKGPTEFWLHVRDDGTEVRYAAPPPDIPTLHVWVKTDDGRVFFQETCTRNIVIIATGERKAVRPRGEGWQLYDVFEDDGFSVWRREVR